MACWELRVVPQEAAREVQLRWEHAEKQVPSALWGEGLAPCLKWWPLCGTPGTHEGPLCGTPGTHEGPLLGGLTGKSLKTADGHGRGLVEVTGGTCAHPCPSLPIPDRP